MRTYSERLAARVPELLIEDMRGQRRGRRIGSPHLLRLADRFVDNLRHGHNVINAFMTPQQRELMSRLQALMALAEGYSNHVMNHVGQGLLPHFAEIQARVEPRQEQRSPIEHGSCGSPV